MGKGAEFLKKLVQKKQYEYGSVSAKELTSDPLANGRGALIFLDFAGASITVFSVRISILYGVVRSCRAKLP